jgi:transposase
MGNRGDLTNEQWERIEPLLPKQETKRGRPSQDHRQMLNGMIWVLRTGAPWRDMPERYGKWTSIYSRFQRWRKSGVWDKMFAELQTVLDVESNVDWEVHFINSTTVRAHQHAAGAKKAVQRQKP